jgi:hypothetical protein
MRGDGREPRRTLMEVKESRMTLSSARQLLRPSRSFSYTVIDDQSLPDGCEGYGYGEEEKFTSRSFSSGSYAADFLNGVWGREGDGLRESIISIYILICI